MTQSKHPFDIKILGTGSNGNAVLIDETILIDCGLGVRKLLPYFDKVRHVFITHRHGDHLQLPILKNVAKKISPAIIKYGLHVNQDCYNKIKKDAPEIAELIETERLTQNSNFDLEINGIHYNVRTYPLHHDVENQGFIFTKDGYKLIHATDTSTMMDAPNEIYDVLLVEGNYDESKFIEALQSDNYQHQYRAGQNLRHLSIQAHENFVNAHSHEDSEIIMLHESYDFGMGLTDELKAQTL